MEAIPWDILSVDIIVPYEIRIKGQYGPLILKPLNIMEPATEWYIIVQYDDKQVAKISNLV